MVLPNAAIESAPRVIAIHQWPLRGGVLALDFANTVGWRPEPRPFDGLQTYGDLLEWSRHAGILSLDVYDRLRARAAREPEAAREALVAAVALREAIYRLFVALARGRNWEADDLATINAHLLAGIAQSALLAEPAGFAFRLADDESALEAPLWMAADSAARLLLTGDWRRVRECPGHDCGWLFLDQTKNGNRRWCDSADCGNRARVRAHAQRQRERARGAKAATGS
jgi:predicted RNA-binding Zn ribbon-like protein